MSIYYLFVELGADDGYDQVDYGHSVETIRLNYKQEWHPLPAYIVNSYGKKVKTLQTLEDFYRDQCYQYHDEDCYCALYRKGQSAHEDFPELGKLKEDAQ